MKCSAAFTGEILHFHILFVYRLTWEVCESTCVFACLQAPSLPSYFTVLVCMCVCIHKYVHIKHKSYKLIGSSKLQLPPQIFFIGLRSGDWLDHFMTRMHFFFSHLFLALVVLYALGQYTDPSIGLME